MITRETASYCLARIQSHRTMRQRDEALCPYALSCLVRRVSCSRQSIETKAPVVRAYQDRRQGLAPARAGSQVSDGWTGKYSLMNRSIHGKVDRCY